MKRVTAIVSAFMIFASQAFAASTITVPMTANVTSNLERTATIFDGPVANNVTVTSMNFGTLTQGADTNLSAPKHFNVLLNASTSGRRYAIRQTASALANGAVTLPVGACIVTPNNNGVAIPAGASLGSRGSFIATDKVIYTSELAGTSRAIGATYAITSDATQGSTAPILRDQVGGAYSSNVVFTLVLV
jgi:hypothetical protein